MRPKKDLAAIQEIDPEAEVQRIKRGPEKGKFYLLNNLRLPQHSTGEAPAADTEEGAVAAFWKWIDAVPMGQWIGVHSGHRGNAPCYRWTSTGWVRWARA